MDIFSKFGVDGLERCLEAEAFAGREISGEDDLLDVLINLADIKSAGGVALRVGIQELVILLPLRTRISGRYKSELKNMNTRWVSSAS